MRWIKRTALAMAVVLLLQSCLLPLEATAQRRGAKEPEYIKGTFEISAHSPILYSYGIGGGFLLLAYGVAEFGTMAGYAERLTRWARPLLRRFQRTGDYGEVPGFPESGRGAAMLAYLGNMASGTHKCYLDFVLEEQPNGRFELKHGTMRYEGSHSFILLPAIFDILHDHGRRSLNPEDDKISLRFIRGATRAQDRYVLYIDASHAYQLHGQTIFDFIPLWGGGTLMTLMTINEGARTTSKVIIAGKPWSEEVLYRSLVDDRLTIKHRLQGRGSRGQNIEHLETFGSFMGIQYLIHGNLVQKPCLITIENISDIYDDLDEHQFIFWAETSSGKDEILENLFWIVPEIPGTSLIVDPQDRRGQYISIHYSGTPDPIVPLSEFFGPDAYLYRRRISAILPDGECANPRPYLITVSNFLGQ